MSLYKALTSLNLTSLLLSTAILADILGLLGGITLRLIGVSHILMLIQVNCIQ